MKKFILITLLYFSPLLWRGAGGEVSAQQHQLDSLKNLLIKNNDGEEKELQLLNAIAPVQVNINPNDALTNSEKAIALAQKLNNQKELAVAFNNKGFILLRKSEYAVANIFLKKSLSINSVLKNQNGIADNQTNLAEILRRQGETDSAKTIFEKALSIYQQQKNTNRIADVYYYLGLVYRDFGDNKNWLFFNDKAIEFHRKTANKNGLALAINSKGNYYSSVSENLRAVDLYNEAIKLNEQIGNLYGLALDYGNVSNSYSSLGDLPRSIDFLLKSLRINEQLGNLQMVANSYILLGGSYFELCQYKKALDFTLKGNLLFENLKISNRQYRMGLNQSGGVFFCLNDTFKALEYLNKSLVLCLEAKDEYGLSFCRSSLGFACLKIKNYDAAIVNIKEALRLGDKLDNSFGSATDYCNLGSAIAEASNEVLRKFDINPKLRNKLVVYYFQKAITIGKETGNMQALRDTHEELSKFYEGQGDNKMSFEYYKKFIAYRDSIMNTNKANSIAMLQMQYDTEKKEQQIALLIKESKLQQTDLQKQNTSRNLLIVACGLIALLAGIIYNRYRLKQKANAEIETTLQHLKSTQEQLIEHEKLASLGKFTSDVAREIEVPVKEINELCKTNRTIILNIKSNNSHNDIEALKNNLLQIFNRGKVAEAVVKKVLTETRKVQG